MAEKGSFVLCVGTVIRNGPKISANGHGHSSSHLPIMPAMAFNQLDLPFALASSILVLPLLLLLLLLYPDIDDIADRSITRFFRSSSYRHFDVFAVARSALLACLLAAADIAPPIHRSSAN
jgi:hypothetical protein